MTGTTAAPAVERTALAGRDLADPTSDVRTEAHQDRVHIHAIAILIAATSFLVPNRAVGEPVVVRHTEGVVRGFLVLRSLDGTTLADGDLIQTVRGVRVTTRLVFHFGDGSLYDETAVFSQRKQFRLVSDHVIQKGPAFPRALDMSINATTGQVRVRYSDDEGKEKVEAERLDLPTDLANGLVLTLLKNVVPQAPPKTIAFVAFTPKPRLVKLAITTAGEESFSTGAATRSAMHYVLKVEIGGITGLVAPLLGKVPPDSHVWILGGEAPTFVKSEQPLYNGGPLWRIELVSPVWPHSSVAK